MRPDGTRHPHRSVRSTTRYHSVVPWTVATAFTIVQLAAISFLASWQSLSKPRPVQSAASQRTIAFATLSSPLEKRQSAQRSTISHRVVRGGTDLKESAPVSAPVAIDSFETSGGMPMAERERETAVSAEIADRLRHTAAACVIGPCMSALNLGVRSSSDRTNLERSSLRYSLMRGIPKAPKLPPLPRPPGTLPPPSGVQVGLWGGGPSAKQRKRDSTIHAANKIVISRIKLRADSITQARQDSLVRARQDSLFR